MKAAIILAALLVGCGSHDRPEPPRDNERHSRVIEPPAGRVRPLPPHAIRNDGVGPYRLGAPRAELLDQLPSGPRIATLDIPDVVRASILRAEDDAILIGGEPSGKAAFVAVVGSEIARTENGIHVGSTRDELTAALGAPVVELDSARDPAVIVPSRMRNARVVLEADRIAAFVLAAEPPAKPEPQPEGCARPVVEDPREQGTCLSGSGEVVTRDGDDLSVRPVDSERALHAHVAGLIYAAPVRSPDGRDELVAVARSEDAEQRTWLVTAFRLDGNRLVPSVPLTQVYRLTATNARWVGADLHGLDLYLEVRSRADSLEVGGLLTTRVNDKLRDIVVISPKQVPRKRAKSAPPEATDAGAVDR